MRKYHNQLQFNRVTVANAFISGILCTVFIGAAVKDRNLGIDFDRDEQRLNVVFTKALEEFQQEVGSDELTFSKNEQWDFVELGYWLGVYSHTVNMAQLVSHYDYRFLDPKERASTLYEHMDRFVADQCKRQTNRFFVLMRRKFESNSPEFKATFGELQTLFSYRADAYNAAVMCPFDEAGLDLYELETEDQAE